jgi:hypothetical protein
MTKLVLGGGALALVAWGGAGLGGGVDAVAVGLFVLAAGLAVVALGLALLWMLPLPRSRATIDPSPSGEAEEGPLHVPVLCYRPNGDVDWLLGELLPRSAG